MKKIIFTEKELEDYYNLKESERLMISPSGIVKSEEDWGKFIL